MKMIQESLTRKYNKLLSFRHEEVIIQNLEGVLQFHQRSASVYLVTLTSSGPSVQSTQKARDTSVVSSD